MRPSAPSARSRRTAASTSRSIFFIRLGSLLIVGEVKCWLYPADPIERFNHLKKLRAAAEQASRKAALLRDRPDVAARALGLSEDICRQLRVVPLVVANQGFGFSLDLGGCIVADAQFLETYLGNGTLTIGAANKRAHRRDDADDGDALPTREPGRREI
jgi:hypothetical protein